MGKQRQTDFQSFMHTLMQYIERFVNWTSRTYFLGLILQQRGRFLQW